MRMLLLSTFGQRGDVEPMVGLAVRGALAAPTEECHAPAATGVMPTGAWR